MATGKAIEVLRTFSKRELKDMSLFLASPYFNTNKALIKLYEVLRKNFTKLDKLTEESIYNEVFPGKSYNYGIFKNLLSELYTLQCRYLAVSRLPYKKDDSVFLLKELLERRLLKHADKVIKDTKEFFSGRRMAIEDYHTDFTVEEYSSFASYFRDKRWLQNLYKMEDPLRMSHKLIIHFLMRLLSHYLFYTTRGLNLENVDLKGIKKIIEDLFKYLKAHLNYDVPNIDVLYYIMKLRESPGDIRTYYILKETLLKNIEKLSWQIMSNSFFYLSEFCEIQIEQGNDEFIKENYTMYLMQVEHRSPGSDFGSLDAGLYEDVVRYGLASGEIAAIQKFINKHKERLPENLKEEAYNFSLAQLNFYKGNYTAASESLAKIENDDFFRKFRVRTLYLMLYYATGEWEGLYSLVTSYKAIVKNQKKLSAEEKEIHYSLINNVYYLAKFKELSFINTKGLSKKLNAFISGVKKEPSIYRPWLYTEAVRLLKSIKRAG